MKGIKIDNSLITNKINYDFLYKKYGDPIDTNLDYDYNIDNLKDVDKGAKLLKKHIDNNSLIILVTDSDCDGITSAVVLYKGLKDVFNVKNKNLITLVNRRKNGNGFNKELVDLIIEKNKERKIDLLIAADHGSNDNDIFKYLKENTEMDLIITDHHTIKKYPTDADIFINPLREDSDFDKSISGCCVAFMLLLKTYKDYFKTSNYNDLNLLLPYVAISIITDCMDISLRYNRLLVKLGLRVMNSRKFIFWEILKSKLGIYKYTETDIGMKIGPLINCGNCLNNEITIYKMLVEENINNIDNLIDKSMGLNNVRKELTNRYAKSVIDAIDVDATVCHIINVEEDAIINGKVAANVGSTFNKPTVIFSEDKKSDCFIGSGRGIIRGLDILGIMHDIHKNDNDIFIKFGGHEGAFGCNIKKNKYEVFKDLFNKFIKEKYSNISDSDFIYPDAFIPAGEINIKLYEEQNKYAPFGINYEEPIYLSRLRLERVINMGSIVKILFSPITFKNRIEGLYFFNDTFVTRDNIKDFINQNVYVAYKLKMSNFRGSYNLTLHVIRMELIDG